MVFDLLCFAQRTDYLEWKHILNERKLLMLNLVLGIATSL